jgi:hypothetical protein
MGYSAEMTLGKRLAYGDNVEKPLTVSQMAQRQRMSRFRGNPAIVFARRNVGEHHEICF